ncbi:hypothetical protein C4B68_30740 [Streptomyces dengpaensis]|uniref:Uncharacterized protein n=1 Tax=Streptomyces dengpaensis TaxID=2049881 RepID=A0ABN5IB14_9ACTN|nr:hypothetical protein C4B68_30740 [Streptomyces dengpaensis]PIB05233.1 hypothetical protein B1C81_29380 [Streptomyces sp. HG99]
MSRMSNAGALGATGRCRAYPRKYVRFFESFQTAGTLRDPPPDKAVPCPASEYGAARRSAQSSVCRLFQQCCSTRPHPREGRGLGNV